MKEVAEEWERYFTCLGENTENSINFKIEKEVKRIYKNEKKKKIKNRISQITIY